MRKPLFFYERVDFLFPKPGSSSPLDSGSWQAEQVLHAEQGHGPCMLVYTVGIVIEEHLGTFYFTLAHRPAFLSDHQYWRGNRLPFFRGTHLA